MAVQLSRQRSAVIQRAAGSEQAKEKEPTQSITQLAALVSSITCGAAQLRAKKVWPVLVRCAAPPTGQKAAEKGRRNAQPRRRKKPHTWHCRCHVFILFFTIEAIGKVVSLWRLLLVLSRCLRTHPQQRSEGALCQGGRPRRNKQDKRTLWAPRTVWHDPIAQVVQRTSPASSRGSRWCFIAPVGSGQGAGGMGRAGEGEGEEQSGRVGFSRCLRVLEDPRDRCTHTRSPLRHHNQSLQRATNLVLQK